ncbi:hypothetical protein Ciccas_003516 [Cichlidogyrus casuarinus]|uniref:Uncharacterized protein n=1 Tax=Cichlidogyrus casuarinus TaxID=1844966 RepID=A0ABD2QE85_9PLAT
MIIYVTFEDENDKILSAYKFCEELNLSKVKALVCEPLLLNELVQTADTVICFSNKKMSILDQLECQILYNDGKSNLEIKHGCDMEKLIQHLSLTKPHKFVKSPKVSLSIQEVLLNCLEFHSIASKKLILAMLEHTSDENQKNYLKELATPQSSRYTEEVSRGLSFMDLLWRCPSCKPPLSAIYDLLPPLAPRCYSICSSPIPSSCQLQFVFNLITRRIDSIDNFPHIMGHVTGRIFSKSKASSCFGVLACMRKSTTNLNLSIPSVHKRILMICSGTGIAPFMSFIRTHSEEKPVLHLLYGCRNPSNLLFCSEMKKSLTNGLLQKATICFSRYSCSDEELKRLIPCHLEINAQYVQDCMLLCKEEYLSFLLAEDSCVMVCGDAKGMGKDIRNAVMKMLTDHFRGTEANSDQDSEKLAKEFFKNMQSKKHYIEEIWS